MRSSNYFSAHFKRRETALKWLFAAFGYCILFAFIEDPRFVTISLIGKTRIPLFCVYCLFYGASMLINTEYMYRNFKVGSKFFLYLSYAFNLSMGLVATTMMPEKSVGEISFFATIVHWVTGFGGIIVNATVVLTFAFAVGKRFKSKIMTGFAAAGTAICIFDLLAFVVITLIMGNPQKGKNGIFEIIPIAVTFIAFHLINHTDLVSPRSQRDALESGFTVSDKSVFSAVSWITLVAATIAFTTYAFVRNPIHYTISMTGLEYPLGFAVVSVLISSALVCNFILLFKRSKYKNPIVIAISMVGSVSLLVCVASPTTASTDLNVIHSIFAVAFFYLIMAALLLFLISKRSEKKAYKAFAAGMAALIAVSLVTVIMLFIVFKQKYGRTGLVEIIPLLYIFLFFLLENHTDLFKSAQTNKNSEIDFAEQI